MEAVRLLEEEFQPTVIPFADDRPDWHLCQIVGRSPSMQRLFTQMRHTARYLRIAAIEGECGTGKMLAARTLHQFGPDPASPFIPCKASQLLEPSTARESSAKPLIQQSSGGTLALTRVDELSPAHQHRLLDLLQWTDHQHIRSSFHAVPRRILFISSRSLRKLASAGAFRADLANQLTAIRFTMPALRERCEDIPLLSDFFVQRFTAAHGKPVRGVSPQALPRLIQHLWPGNVRELESVICAAALACHGEWIRPLDLPAFNAPNETPASSPDTTQSDDPNLDRAILRHIQKVLARADGNKFRAAKLLGISRSTLYRLLDSASISSPQC